MEGTDLDLGLRRYDVAENADETTEESELNFSSLEVEETEESELLQRAYGIDFSSADVGPFGDGFARDVRRKVQGVFLKDIDLIFREANVVNITSGKLAKAYGVTRDRHQYPPAELGLASLTTEEEGQTILKLDKGSNPMVDLFSGALESLPKR